MDKLSIVENNFLESIELKKQIYSDKNMLQQIVEISNLIIKRYQNDGKVLFCGNGGSAADAQHLAAEFSGRYYYDRPPLFAEALHVNTSYLTAVANDYSYDEIYSRLIKAYGRKDDILFGLSTSGNSPNVINALQQAKSQGVITIGLSGKDGGKMNDLCDYIFKIPSKNTPRIQECHMLIGHTICELVEQGLFPK